MSQIDPFSEFERQTGVRIQTFTGWKALLIIVPLAALAIFLGVFLFAIFAALFAVIGAIVAGRLWWLNRKLRNQPGPTTLEGNYTIIERHTEVIQKSRREE